MMVSWVRGRRRGNEKPQLSLWRGLSVPMPTKLADGFELKLLASTREVHPNGGSSAPTRNGGIRPTWL